MNQLFIDKLHESMNDKNKNLLEAVELLYRTCEQKAQLESKFGKAAAIGGIAAGSYLTGLGTGVANADKINGAIDAGKQTVQQMKDDANQYVKDENTVATVKNRSYDGLALKNKGYKFVSADQKPELFKKTDSGVPSFNGIAVSDLDKQPYVQAGWYVSPDGTKYYSTITGDVYKMPEGQTFDNATAENPGNRVGPGVLMTGDVTDDDVEKCSISMAGKYGPDKDCGPAGYVLHDDKYLDWVGAEK